MSRLVAIYRHFSDKRYSTIAGTLVYFLLMSITPALFWLALMVGKINLSDLSSLAFFEAIEPLLSYLNEAAQNAASGAGLVLIATSLYSSANFFYHLRRSGEIIYDCDRKRGGLRLRLASVGLVLATLAALTVLTTVAVAGSGLLSRFLPGILADAVRICFSVVIAFVIAEFLNIFACPHKLGFSGALCGSLLTTALWLLFGAGFTLYLQFSDPSKLYGAVATVIIFLLWSYLMMSGLVAGMIYNAMYFPDAQFVRAGMIKRT